MLGGGAHERGFTAPVSERQAVQAPPLGAVTRIGRIEATPGQWLIDSPGHPQPLCYASFNHFA